MNFLFFFARYQQYKNVYSAVDAVSIFALIFFVVIVYIIAANKYEHNSKLYKHFLACFLLKLIGCLLFIFIYTFYYGAGDTFSYYLNAKPLIDMASYDPSIFLEVISQTSLKHNILIEYPEFWDIRKPNHYFLWHSTTAENMVIRFAAFFGVFSLGSYLVVSLYFAMLSSFGIWALYRTFTRMFPGHENAIAIPLIYLPSLWFWGSPLMKDSIVICFLGFFTYALYNIFIRKKGFFLSSILIAISMYILIYTKEYVLISYTPALLLWFILSLGNRLPDLFQFLLRPILLVLALGSIFVVGPKIGEVSERYAVDAVLSTAQVTGEYILRTSESQDGSSYSFGEISYTPQGLIKLFPQAVTVTLFRPFIFEVKNIVMLISAFESSVFLFFTIFVIFRVGPLNYLNYINKNPFLLAALVFSLFFAFAIGVSTLNFGSLARYKLPCLPFYGLAIVLPYSFYIKKRKRFKELVIVDS